MSSRLVFSALLCLALAALPAACGTDNAGAGDGIDGGSGASGDSGDLFGPGADASESTGNPDGGSGADACASSTVQASTVTKPVDIIVLVDNSSSMQQEVVNTNQNLNEFSKIIEASGLDYHVVMISMRGTHTSSYPYQICIPPPLAGASCGNSSRFLHIDQEVLSQNPLKLITSTYTSANTALNWSGFVRKDSQKYFLVITDDNSSISATTFNANLTNADPQGVFKGYVFNGIYGFDTKTECPSLAQVGTVYTTLVTNTKGSRARVCEADWKPIFQSMAQKIVSGAQVSCQMKLPPPPPGKTLATSKVSVIYTPGAGGAPVELQKVDGLAQCAGASFYFDNNTSPTEIILCPSYCSTVQSDAAAKLEVMFACKTNIQ